MLLVFLLDVKEALLGKGAIKEALLTGVNDFKGGDLSGEDRQDDRQEDEDLHEDLYDDRALVACESGESPKNCFRETS